MKTNANSPQLMIDGIIIPVTPDPEHEYTLPTAQVAAGYGVGASNIREMKRQHSDELYEGKHFISVTNSHANPTGVRIPDARHRGLKLGNDTVIHWTKRGIVRLGFFIRSERAKRFRDLAEDLILRDVAAITPGADVLLSELRAFRAEVAQVLTGLGAELAQVREENLCLKKLLTAPNPAAKKRLLLPMRDPDHHDTAQLVTYLADNVGHPVKFPEVLDFARALNLFRGKTRGVSAAGVRSAVGKALLKFQGEVFELAGSRHVRLIISGKCRARRWFAEPVMAE